MKNSMILLTFFVFDRKHSFWANLVQKIRIVSLRRNLILTLIQICRIQWWCSLFWLLTGNTFLGEIWSKKIKIISLRWILIPRLIGICKTKWCCSLFSFSIGNPLFWANLVENVKIVRLRLNLVASLIRICRTEWCCSRFSFSNESAVQNCQFNLKIVLSWSAVGSLAWNLVLRLIGIVGLALALSIDFILDSALREEFSFCFSRSLCYYWLNYILAGGRVLGSHPMGFRHFLDIF